MNNNKIDVDQTEQHEKDNQENQVYFEENEEKNKLSSKANKEIKTDKGHNGFIASTFATLIMVLLFTILSVGSYDSPLREKLFPTQNNTEAYIQSYDFANTLSQLTRYLLKTKVEGNDWYAATYEDVESIKYYISNREDAIVNVSNMSDVTDELLEEEIKDSQFYLHLRFDENGKPDIENSLDKKFPKEAFISNLVNRIDDQASYANLDIFYIIPKDFEGYKDLFTSNMKRFYVIPYYLILILVIGAISIIILTIIAFSLPYSSQSKATICRLYNKMFLEIKCLLWFGFIMLSMAGLFSMNGNGNNGFNVAEVIYHANVYFYLIGLPVTFILYLLIYLTVVYIKYIYYKGFKEGILRNGIVGRMCLAVLGSCKRFIKQIMEIDIRKDHHKKLVLILGINLLALWIIALFPVFGFVLAIAYSVFLFKYLLKLIDKVKSLDEATSQLAEGNFAITLDENIGVFSPISKNLNNIKEGFRLAVDKEIKSQKMKAELISNVSHDLKTPLTSIITYVDLMKNQDITSETQKEYIDILDKKSKRLKILIEDLFEASKANSGNVELYLERLDVVALLRQTLGELEEKINNSSLQMKINVPENKVICKLDGRRTYRIFENIMSNTLKYALPNSRVYIDVVENQQEVSVVFKNISAYEMNFDTAEITERFTRGDISRNTEGSGLGLAIAKSFIELQNGKLEVIIDGDLFKLIVSFPKV